MTIQGSDERWNEIKTIWKQNQWLYVVAGFLAGLLFEPFVQGINISMSDFLQSLVPEAIGIAFTVLLIDRLTRRRDEQREERQLKTQLIRQLKSTVNHETKRAAEELLAYRWLRDGTLRGAVLENANLEDASLIGGDLQRAFLVEAKLNRAKLMKANLRDADLEAAELNGANLERANLYGASLIDSNLAAANLKGANMQRAHLENAHFDENTILPDGTFWTIDTDFGRFTDSQHPNVWHSNDHYSPAYGGKMER